MKIKLDENMPVDLVTILEQLGHNVDSSPEEGLTGAADDEVWRVAQSDGRFLITQDLDFSNVHQFVPGTHHGILLVRLSPATRRSLIQFVQVLFQNEAVNEWAGCFVVASRNKLRIRRPKN